MAEYISIASQAVSNGQNIIFTDTPVACTKGYVIHRAGSGIFTIKGITDQCRARYRVTYSANVSLPSTGATGAVSTALALNGEPLQESVTTVTIGALTDAYSVEKTVIIDVPRCCCYQVAVENITAQAVNYANSVIIIERVA